MTKKWSLPIDVDGASIAFGGDMSKLLPAMSEIPKEFKDGHTKWNKLFSTWFYRGLKNANWKPKEGVDTEKALRHIKAIMCSWDPKHEHKIAGVAFLLSEFFEDVTYEPAK